MSRHRVVITASLLLACGLAAFAFCSMWERGDQQIVVNDQSAMPLVSTSNQRHKPLSDAKAASDLSEALSAMRASTMSPEARKPADKKAPPLVRIDHGRLSVEALNVRLDKLLAAISDTSGIPMFNDKTSAQRISVAFEDLPLDEGLRRLLKDQDIFFLYGAGQAERRPVALWIYPRGKGRQMVPAPPESWASTAELEQDVSTNPDWGARMRAVETVIERKGNQSLDTVQYALNDPNPSVRYSALSGALTVGIALPDGTLENLAQYDPSAFVRSLALKTIAEAPGADKLQVRSMAEAALADPHPDVQATARDILASLRHADQPQTLSNASLRQSSLRLLLRR